MEVEAEEEVEGMAVDGAVEKEEEGPPATSFQDLSELMLKS